MKIEKISYQKTYSIGPYLTDRIGFEATVDNWESCADVLDNLRAKADEWHKSEHPHLYQESELIKYAKVNHTEGEFTPINFNSSATIVIDLSHEKMEIAIDNCQTIEELKAWKENNPIMPAPILKYYNSRMEILRIEENNKSMGEKNKRQ